jgi:hypothetical protein
VKWLADECFDNDIVWLLRRSPVHMHRLTRIEMFALGM